MEGHQLIVVDSRIIPDIVTKVLEVKKFLQQKKKAVHLLPVKELVFQEVLFISIKTLFLPMKTDIHKK